MYYSFKRIWFALVLFLICKQSCFGFALLGPLNESWQVPAIGYGLAGDSGGPKDLGDGYRWNTRNIYYACDASFFDFFGPDGAAEVDKAFAVYNALTNFSTYSSNLTEWPLTTSRYNPTAQNLQLMDVKSMTMSWLANMLGLAQPDRYTWDIHDRFAVPPSVCPVDIEYVTVQRNFDPATYTYSSFVNGTLYDYTIIEGCTTSPIVALASEFPVDPTTISQASTAVAGGYPAYYGAYAPVPGRYYTGLTRDDVGGLRYLYATNRMNRESVSTNSLLLSTNRLTQILTTSSLQILTQEAMTNSPGALQTLFPDLAITSFTNYFSNVVTTNIEAFYITNGNPPVVFVTNFTTNVETFFDYTFGNVITNHFYTNGFVVTQVTNVGVNPFAPILITNQFATLLTTSNLALLTAQSLTNDPAALQALYPDIVITGFTNAFTNVVTTNITAFFTNPPFGQAGVAVLKLTTNFTTNVETLFQYTFANVVTNHFYTSGFITTQITNLTFTTSPFGAAGSGSLKTNVSTKTVFTHNYTNGDYYVVPTNLFGYDIISTQLISVIPITNTFVFATNAPGVTNLAGQSFSLNIISYFTNYNYIAYPIVAFPGAVQTNVISTTNIASFVNGDYYIVPPGQFNPDIISTQLVTIVPITNVFTFATNAPGVTATNLNFTENIITFSTNYTLVEYSVQLLAGSVAVRQGVDKMNFIRRDFDSLLDNFWDPITNYYSLTAIVSNKPMTQTFQRIITRPDVVFQSSDHILGNNAPAFISIFDTLNFATNNPSSDGVGPGNIEPQTVLVFGKGGGPIFINEGVFFEGEFNATPFVIWGKFDGSTNAPTVYPTGSSLAALQDQVFFQILSGLLPNGSVSGNNSGSPYSTQLQAQGASPPFTWALAAGSSALPNGLNLSSDGVISGSLSAASVGTYDFSVQATDSIGRVTQANLVIEIDP